MPNPNLKEGVDFMLDLETMGFGPDSVITEASFVVFNPFNPQAYNNHTKSPENYLQLFPSVREQLFMQRRVNEGTQRWWAGQNKEAISVQVLGEDMLAKDIALKLANFFEGFSKPWYIWSKPSRFDVTIFEHYLNMMGITVPWGRRDVMDVYTCYRLTGASEKNVQEDEQNLKHSGLGDCYYQIKVIHSIYSDQQ